MEALPSGAEGALVGDIGPETDWSEALDGIEGIVHLASRVHVMRESTSDPLAAYREVNVAGTKRLARQAAEAGVKRLVYISSVKVNGERSGERDERPTSNTRRARARSRQVERPTSNEKQKKQKPEVRGQGTKILESWNMSPAALERALFEVRIEGREGTAVYAPVVSAHCRGRKLRRAKEVGKRQMSEGRRAGI